MNVKPSRFQITNDQFEDSDSSPNNHREQRPHDQRRKQEKCGEQK